MELAAPFQKLNPKFDGLTLIVIKVLIDKKSKYFFQVVTSLSDSSMIFP